MIYKNKLKINIRTEKIITTAYAYRAESPNKLYYTEHVFEPALGRDREASCDITLKPGDMFYYNSKKYDMTDALSISAFIDMIKTELALNNI